MLKILDVFISAMIDSRLIQLRVTHFVIVCFLSDIFHRKEDVYELNENHIKLLHQ